ncbi:MFS transporter [Microbacterium sp. HD4P20]|uniref:MFS transporter n=1 Tax=Microbacterium sp. HD4P20 TaxID=2864874 RepID=UPI001C640634|nr:MFS transporter [Microbacterium sp. HD4P20]MCP2638127.1 MFS transporter [Microbacterium sp. HD4P20]
MSRSWPARVVLPLAAVNLTALGALTAPVVAGLPLKVSAAVPDDQRTATLATLVALGAVVALVASPLFGALSDRTRGRFGRRTPWIVGGAIVGLGTTTGFAMSTDLGPVTLWWMATQAAYNAVLAGTSALLADSVTEGERASASGVFTAASFVGTLPPLLLIAVLPHQVSTVMFVMPVAAVVAAVACAFVVPDSPLARQHAPTAAEAESDGMADAAAPASAHDTAEDEAAFERPRAVFVAVWVQRFAVGVAFSLIAAFTLYLVSDRMTGDDVAAASPASLATLLGGAGVVTGALVAGAWASRRGRYVPALVAGTVLLAAAGVLKAVATAPPTLWAAALCAGLGMGAILALNFALAMRSVPAARTGTYLGVLNIAETLPQLLVPLVAASLVRVGGVDPFSGGVDNYVTLYLTGAVVALATIALLPAMRSLLRSRADAGARPVSAGPARTG